MIQHIEQLFEETKTIILPGLGALTITNPDTRELMFMPYLKHDDGVLKAFIASKEGISEDDSKSKLDGFIADIQAKLDAGQPAPFGSMGNFEKDADGDIVFKNQEAETAAPVEETPVVAAPIPEPIADPIAETPPIVEAPAEADVPEANETPIIDEAPAAEEAPEAPIKTAEEVLEPEAEVTPTSPEPETIAPEEPTVPKEMTLADEIKAAEKEAPAADPIPDPIAEVTPEAAPEIKAPVETPSPAATKTIAEEIEAAETAPKTAVPPVPPVSETPTPKEPAQKPLNILEKEEIEGNRKKLNDLRAQKEAPKKRKKRGAGFYILMVFIVLIAGGGTYVGLNYDQFKDYLPFESSNAKLKDNSSKQIAEMKKTMGTNEVPKNETEVTPETTEPETTEPETTETKPEVTKPEVAKPEVKKPQPKPQVTGSNNQPFHIVAGVFGSPENAERMATKLKGMGHPAKTFARGGQTVVSVQSFATQAEAEAALSNVKDAAPKGWVLEWRN